MTARLPQYVAQDVHYLRDYARALAIVAAKAPTLADTAMFTRHAAEVFDVELALHNELLPELGLDAAALNATPVTPTTRAYTSYLLATAYGRQVRRGVGGGPAVLLDLRPGRDGATGTRFA